MRDIKFRAFDIENKEMLKVENLYFNNISNKVEIKTLMYSDYFNENEMALMQYTGLKDKNEKEIYEGDIVKIIVNNKIEKICVIEFKNGIFGVMFSKQVELTAVPHFYNTTFEVIGNIYENPELLEKEGE